MSKSEMWLTEGWYCEGDNGIPEVETVNTSLIDIAGDQTAQITFSVRELETSESESEDYAERRDFLFDYLMETDWCVIGVKAKGYLLNNAL